MTIPMKHEDVVARLDAALEREAVLMEKIESLKSEAALVEILGTPDQFAVSQDRHRMQLRLTFAKQRARELEMLLLDAEDAHGKMLLSDPPQEAWKHHRISERIAAALKPAENHLSRLPDFWPCKSAEELAKFEAWKIEKGEDHL